MCIERWEENAAWWNRIKSREKIGKRNNKMEDKRGKSERVRNESMCSIEELLKRRAERRA